MVSRRRNAFLTYFPVVVLVLVGLSVVVALRPELIADLVTSRQGDATSGAKAASTTDSTTVEVSEKGLGLLKTSAVDTRDFKQELRDVGVIDFDQDMTVAVFPPYQGKIIQPLVDLGDKVEKDQVLYTINSPDLVQAEQTVIQTAGVLDLATKNLGRLRQSVKNGGGAQKDLDQAQSDLQTAIGAYNSARQALGIFGKTNSDADRIATSRTVDPMLPVRSPISGTVTVRNASAGMFVQPGTAPAPYNVSDLSRVRMYDFVSEAESPAIRVGADVRGRVIAYPNRTFNGKVTAIATAVDPGTHRLQVESLIPDPGSLLRPNMFAELVIRTGAPVRSTAVPTDAVVRLGDGTMTVWVATQARRFSQRVVKIGLQQDGFDQVLEGIRPGETVVTQGAVYVSNVANVNASP